CWIVWDKENTGNFADVELAWCSDKRGAKLYKYLWNGMSRKGDRKSEGATRVHPTQKPVGLFVDIFKEFSFNSCFDGFGGSGSTLIACEKTGRNCYMMELDPKYCDVIIKRWEDFTGKKAELTNAR
ncbi:MAG TPA: DNA methyltransferase, partial [Candidatus Rifleibacterium sp.]|nr:DNA methyltransferase [Candidatus Rifleibacterium sp.]